MTGKGIYTYKLIHLRLDAIYAAEQVVLELEQAGHFDELWQGEDLKAARKRAIGAVSTYLKSKFTPDKRIEVLPNRFRSGFAGSRIIAALENKHVPTMNTTKFQEARMMLQLLNADPRLLEISYQPAFTPDYYLQAMQLREKADDLSVETANLAEEAAADIETVATELEKNVANTGVQEADERQLNDSNKELQSEASSEEHVVVLKTSLSSRRWLMYLSLVALSLSSMVMGALFYRGKLADIGFIREQQGAAVVEEIIERHIEPNADAKLIISQIKDEKDLYRYAENALLSGKVEHARTIFEYLLYSSSDPMMDVFARFKLGEALLYQGEIYRARSELTRALEGIKTTQFKWYGPEILQFLALSYLLAEGAEGVDEALAFLHQAETIIDQSEFSTEQNRHQMVAAVARTKGLTFLILGEYQQARELFQLSARSYNQGNNRLGEVYLNIFLALTNFLLNEQEAFQRALQKVENFSLASKEARVHIYLVALRSFTDRCQGIDYQYTKTSIDSHYQQTGSALPKMLVKLYTTLPCPERKP